MNREIESQSGQPDRSIRPLAEDAEQQVEEIAERFLDQLQAGEAPDASVVAAAHPELAGLLETRLAFVQTLHQAARKRRANESWGTDTPAAARTSADTLSVPLSLSVNLAAAAPIHEQIGRYLIRALLGHGTSGMVYSAYDPKFDREVALKVFRSPGPLGTDFAERFQREARIAAQLRHPHIVPVHDAGEHEGRPYIDMGLVRGQTLEARLKRGPLPFREAAELVRKLADALDYAHSFGIIHRDVKPANILLDERGQPQLTDFGLARRASGETSITEEGQVLGTPDYVSPEQAGGGAHKADRRTDVYSLGAVLYRLLTGRVPLPAEEPNASACLAAHVYRILHTDPVPPRKVNAAVPRDLETICLKAMAKEPEERFASAADLAEELRRWLQDEPLRVHPPTWRERLRRWARRNRLAARITGVAALLLLSVTGTLGGMIWVQHQQLVDAELLRTKQRLLETQESEDRVVKVAAFALLEQARQRMRIPTMGRRTETLDLLRRVAVERRKIGDEEVGERLDLEARSVLAEALGMPDLEVKEVELPTIPFVVWRAALHPSGKAMAIGTQEGPRRWDPGQHYQDAPLPEPQHCLSYSPHGKYLVFAPSAGGLEVWDEGVGQRLEKRGPAEVGRALALGFDRNGETLWICCDDGRVQSFTLPALQPIAAQPFKVRVDTITAAAFNADASQLSVGNKAGQVLLYETTGKETRSLPEGRLKVEALAWSPDSNTVAVGTQDGAVQLWPVKEGPPSNPFILGWPGVSSIQFAPDGLWFVAGFRQGMRMWDVATGEQLLTGPGSPWSVSPDGRCLVSGGLDRVAFSELLMPRAVRHFRGHRTSVDQLAWSCDNRHLASLDSRFEVRVWNMDSEASRDAFFVPPGDLYASNAAVALSDDGRQLAYASGGKTQAIARIYELPGAKQIDEWQLKGGFDRLACIGGRKFLLVREQLGKDRHVQSVVLELEAGKERAAPRVIRCNVPGEKSFLSSRLMWDGRYYLWVGPRDPVDNQRVEVLEVATGILKEKRNLRKSGSEPAAYLSPDGRRLWTDDGEQWLYDLGDVVHSGKRVSNGPGAVSPDAHWLGYRPMGPNDTFALRKWDEKQPWLALDAYQAGFCSSSFSPNSRYLALGKPNGYVTVLNLPELEKEIADFEKTLPK